MSAIGGNSVKATTKRVMDHWKAGPNVDKKISFASLALKTVVIGKLSH
jgi:hypothetical protein